MDDRLAVKQHFNLFRGQVEQMMSLDDLQGLVHQRRRVDRDLRPHVPGRMIEGLVDGHLGQRLQRNIPQRASGGRQHDLLNLVVMSGRHGLKNRRVLAIDRQHVNAGGTGAVHHEFARHDQRLFVGERQRFFRVDGRQCRRQSRTAHHGQQHEVHLGHRRELGVRLRSGQYAAGRTAQRFSERLGVGLFGNADCDRLQAAGLLGQKFPVAVRRERHGAIVAAEMFDHRQRIVTDAAGAAEYRNTFAHLNLAVSPPDVGGNRNLIIGMGFIARQKAAHAGCRVRHDFLAAAPYAPELVYQGKRI